MLLRLLLLPLVALLRLLLWPIRAFRRTRAATPGALLEVTIRGSVPEGPPRPEPRWSLRGIVQRRRRSRTLRLPALRKLIDEAIVDPRVAGLLVTMHPLGDGWASLEALREELVRVRAAGKRLVVWLPQGAGNREIYVASAGTTLVAPPTVDVALTGIKSERHFLRGALDLAGLDVELHARKEFKSAADGLVRSDRSPGDRLQSTAIVEAIDRALVSAIADGRKLDDVAARALLDAGPTRASVAKERGLIDLVGHDDDLEVLLGAKLQPASRYLEKRRALRDLRPLLPRRRKVIAIVEVHGTITSGATPLARAMGPVALEEQVVADLRAAERDPRVAAVVLDVDSRGGTVTASDAMYAAAARLARKKPVIARMADVAASGGYYVASAGRAIVARPLTLTGSIGVVAARPIAARLADRLGITRDVIARGRYADLDAVTRAPTDDERALIAREIDGHYESFVGIVAGARGRPFDEIEPLARGRVYVGSEAHDKRLVDHLGGLDRALALAREAVPGVVLDDEPSVIAARLPSRRLDADSEKRASIALSMIVELLPDALRRALAPAAAVAFERARVLALMP